MSSEAPKNPIDPSVGLHPNIDPSWKEQIEIQALKRFDEAKVALHGLAHVALHNVPGAITELRADINERRIGKLERREDFYESLGGAAIARLSGDSEVTSAKPKGFIERAKARKVTRILEDTHNAVQEKKRFGRIYGAPDPENRRFGGVISPTQTKARRATKRVSTELAYATGSIDPFTRQDEIKESRYLKVRKMHPKEKKFGKEVRRAERYYEKLADGETVGARIASRRKSRAEKRLPKLQTRVQKHREAVAKLRGVDVSSPTIPEPDQAPTILATQAIDISSPQRLNLLGDNREVSEDAWKFLEGELERRALKTGHAHRMNDAIRWSYRKQLRKEYLADAEGTDEEKRAFMDRLEELDAKDQEARNEKRNAERGKGEFKPESGLDVKKVSLLDSQITESIRDEVAQRFRLEDTIPDDFEVNDKGKKVLRNDIYQALCEDVVEDHVITLVENTFGFPEGTPEFDEKYEQVLADRNKFRAWKKAQSKKTR